MIMLHDLCVTVCVCSEGSALFHIASDVMKCLDVITYLYEVVCCHGVSLRTT